MKAITYSMVHLSFFIMFYMIAVCYFFGFGPFRFIQAYNIIVIQRKNQMKPKFSNESLNLQINLKSFVRKNKSPASKKQKNRNDKEMLSFLGLQKNKATKKRDQTLKNEQKIDSNNTTANCTYSRSKIIKSSTLKHGEKVSSQLKRNDNQMSGLQIMIIINKFATKIQKQWKVYIFRQRFKALVLSIRQNNHIKQVFKKQASKNTYQATEKGTSTHKKVVPYVLFEQNGEIISSYDLYKYEQNDVLNSSKENSSIDPISHRSNISINNQQSVKINNTAEISKKEKILKKIASQKNYYEHQRSNNFNREQIKKPSKQISNLSMKAIKPKSQQIRIQVEQKVQESQHQKQTIERRSSFDIYQQQSINLGFNRRHSTGQIKLLNNIKRQIKPLQIDKVIQIEIKTDKKLENPLEEQKKYSTMNRIQNVKKAFNTKFPLQKALNKRKKQMQLHKLKNLLSIENRYNKQEMTYRSYLSIIKKINEDYDYKIKQFHERQGLIKSNWIQLVDIIKPTKSSNRFLEDQMDGNSIVAYPDVSMSFDKWDFHSSAKKSFQQQLDLSENYTHTGKIISFESVLRQLQEEQKKQQTEYNNNFKKIKSGNNIESIAERSKQISEKDISQFSEHLQDKDAISKTYKKEKEQVNPNINKYEETTTSRERLKHQNNDKKSQELLITPKISYSIEFQSDKKSMNKDLPAKNDSHSLMASQIDALQSNQHIFSDRSCHLTEQKIQIKDLIFRDFKLDLQSKSQKKSYETILQEFKDLIHQKFILNNIKLINSIKFIFGRLGEQKQKKKNLKQLQSIQLLNYPPIDSKVDGINTWLLQVSHFILDNFQKIVKDNLVNIKQPSGLELLELSRKNFTYINVYQTVPQFVFKDFQFFYIKNTAIARKIQAQQFDNYSTLFYNFNRCLIDCLNMALMQELITGKNWLELPWRNDFKKKKKIDPEHAKTCLQRSINMVSNWAQYGLGKLSFDDEITQSEYRYYQEQKISLVSRQQVNAMTLSSIITESHLLLLISNAIYESQIEIFLDQVRKINIL